MAGGPEVSVRQEPRDVKAARWWERKSLIVAGIALAVGVTVPFLATIALKVATFEGAQAGGSRIYTIFRAPKKS